MGTSKLTEGNAPNGPLVPPLGIEGPIPAPFMQIGVAGIFALLRGSSLLSEVFFSLPSSSSFQKR